MPTCIRELHTLAEIQQQPLKKYNSCARKRSAFNRANNSDAQRQLIIYLPRFYIRIFVICNAHDATENSSFNFVLHLSSGEIQKKKERHIKQLKWGK